MSGVFADRCTYVVLFFFKQQTSYEMRISDWSADVCSSDLLVVPVHLPLVDEDGDRRRGHRLAGGAGGEDGVGVDLPGRTELAYAVTLRMHHFPVLDDGDRKSTRLNSSH